MNSTTRLVLVAALLGALAAPARGVPISYKLSGIASGSLGATSFINLPFEITATADTFNVYTPSSGIFRAPTPDAMITVEGIGSGMFFGSIVSAVNQNLSRVGFSSLSHNATILFAENPAAATYDMKSSITLTGQPGFNTSFPFETTAGDFRFRSMNTLVTFQATVVPEPTTLAIGFTVLGAARRYRRRASTVTSPR